MNLISAPFTLESFQQIFSGFHQDMKLLPNFEEKDPLEVTHALIHDYVYPGTHFVKVIHNQNVKGVYARVFLGRTQSGEFDGTGTILYSPFWKELRAARFAICKHTPVEDAGANHQRGWHPAHCTQCGLDLSVDSGD